MVLKIPFKELLIGIYSLSELDVLVRSQSSFESELDDAVVSGFEFLRRDSASLRMNSWDSSYKINNRSLKNFEKQSVQHDLDWKYDFGVAATTDSEILGIHLFQWVQSSFSNQKIWLYKSRFLEVRDDYRHKGIATDMLEFIEQDEIVQNKVVRFGRFEPDGLKYLPNVINRVFSHDTYLLLPALDYNFKEFPSSFGCYIPK